MAVSAKIFVLAGLILMFAAPARAQDAKPVAAPAERCEGTLCDLYYGSRGANAATPAQPAAAGVPTPVVAPSGGIMNSFSRSNGPANAQPAEPPSATNSYMSMGGGGLLGGRQERCEGTLCDAYYGSSKSSGEGATVTAARQQAAAVAPVVHRHIVHESETRPKCSSPNADPWRCYR